MTKERSKLTKKGNPSPSTHQMPMRYNENVSAPGKRPIQDLSEVEKNLTTFIPVSGRSDLDLFMEKFGEMIPESLHEVRLESGELIFGDVKGDLQVYLIDKVTSKLKLFYVDGDVSDATLFSDQLSAKRIHGTRVDRYRPAIDMESDDLTKAHEFFNLLGDLANTPRVMDTISTHTKVQREEIDVVVHGKAISIYIFVKHLSFF